MIFVIYCFLYCLSICWRLPSFSRRAHPPYIHGDRATVFAGGVVVASVQCRYFGPFVQLGHKIANRQAGPDKGIVLRILCGRTPVVWRDQGRSREKLVSAPDISNVSFERSKSNLSNYRWRLPHFFIMKFVIIFFVHMTDRRVQNYKSDVASIFTSPIVRKRVTIYVNIVMGKNIMFIGKITSCRITKISN